MKKIVTHFAPDLDAVASIWLVRRFMPGFEEAEVFFVPAGETLDEEPVDSNPNILHVDTGLGKFDHHFLNEDSSAAKKVLEELKNKNEKIKNDEALERLVEVVNDIDHFRQVFYPNPTADFYDFSLEEIFDGLKLIYRDEDEKIVEFGLLALDGVYKKFQNKIWAERLLKEGREFETKLGKGIGMETTNDEVIPLGLKIGYKIVLRKDPKKGYVRIKARPESEINLRDFFEKLKKADPGATWFFHPGGKMILNGSTKNPKTKPTRLTLKKIIEILRGGGK